MQVFFVVVIAEVFLNIDFKVLFVLIVSACHISVCFVIGITMIFIVAIIDDLLLNSGIGIRERNGRRR